MTPARQIEMRLLSAVNTVPAGELNDREIGRLIFQGMLGMLMVARMDAGTATRQELVAEQVEKLERDLLALSKAPTATGGAEFILPDLTEPPDLPPL